MEDLRLILSRNGFSFKKQFGQNFITDTNLLKSIAESAGIDENSTVVEIGTGAGTLTREIAKIAKKVYSFEVDKNLRPVLEETLSGLDNVEVIFRDFLKTDIKEFEKSVGEYTVIANLPYYITSPLVMKFVEESEKVKNLVIMVQEEVALRFCAKENTSDYGAITAAIALRGESKIIKRVSRNMFYPRPNVDSAVVKIDFVENRIPVKDKNVYRETVRCAFLSRRKTLENNMVNCFKMTRDEVKQILAESGIPEKARGETLSPEKLALLADKIFEYKKGQIRR